MSDDAHQEAPARRSTRTHLTVRVVVALVVSIGGVALASALAMRRVTRSTVSRVAIHETRSFANILAYEVTRNYELTDERGLSGFLHGVASRRPEIGRMRIVDTQGRVIASLDASELGKALPDEQLWRALEGRPADAQLTGEHRDQVAVWTPLVIGTTTSAPRGAFFLELSQAELSSYFLQAQAWSGAVQGFAALLTALALGLYLERRVVRRVRELAKVARRVAARDLGALDAKMADDASDEIGELSSAFYSLGRTMIGLVERLRSIATAIETASRTVGETSRDLHQGASNQRALAESASDRLEQHVRTLAELGQTAREAVDRSDQSGRDAQEISAAANELVGVAARAGESIESSVRGIAEVASALKRILSETDYVEKATVTVRSQAERVFQTSDLLRHEARESARGAATLATAAEGSSGAISLVRNHAKEINEQVTAVDAHIQILNPALEAIVRTANDVGEIADQTRVLALNASILAARAGEAGAGFRVVASRVRDLATSTRDSARSIAELASSIEKTAPAVLSSVGTTRGRVIEMVKESDRATRELEAILTEAGMLRGATGRMESASDEQTEAAKQLLATATDTAVRVERLAHAASLQRDATDRLERAGSTLREAASAVDTRAHQQEHLASGIADAASRDSARLRTLGETALSGVASSHAAKQATAQIVSVSGQHAKDVAGFAAVVVSIANEATTLSVEVSRFKLSR